MKDYFEEVADMMASSLTAGQLNTREQILDKLHAKFKTAAQLRAKVRELRANAEAACGPNTVMLIEDAKHPGTWFVVTNGPAVH